MASLNGKNIDLEYSINDGTVRYFKLNGEILVDQAQRIQKEGWKETLWQWGEEHGKLTGTATTGWRAWAIRLADDLGRELPTEQ